MEPIFIRVRSGSGGKVATFPISAFGSLEHTTRGNVYAVSSFNVNIKQPPSLSHSPQAPTLTA